MLFSTLSMSFNWHSQITREHHPSELSSSICRPSLCRLVAIFVVQNSIFDFGIRPREHSCPCQKQPWTKITFLLRMNTRSGLPGKSARCNRYRYPILCTSRLTSISGFVSFDRTFAICTLRCSGVRLSIHLNSRTDAVRICPADRRIIRL